MFNKLINFFKKIKEQITQQKFLLKSIEEKLGRQLNEEELAIALAVYNKKPRYKNKYDHKEKEAMKIDIENYLKRSLTDSEFEVMEIAYYYGRLHGGIRELTRTHRIPPKIQKHTLPYT